MKPIQSKVKPIIWHCRDGVTPSLQVLDQRLLPHEKKYLELTSYKQVIDGIKNMTLRGAPLIGIVAAYGMALAAVETCHGTSNFVEKLKDIAEEIKQSRPTAVNLKWAIDLILSDIRHCEEAESRRSNPDQFAQTITSDPALAMINKKIIDTITKRAIWIHEDDAMRCQKIGEHGAKIMDHVIARKHEVLTKQSHNRNNVGEIASRLKSLAMTCNVLTICNTGALATGGIGTAFGVILTTHRNNKNIKVFVAETRPRQQGAKLTTFECIENEIDCTLISDAACGYLMQKGEIDFVIAGADRIAANGDTANKIGTYQLAVLAKENDIPFYIAAPLSTFDLSCKSGEDIPIEERHPEEIININGKPICASGVKVRNPAFDITPAKYISGIITEKGVLKGGYMNEIRNIFNTATFV